jgi:PPM family protein phosphatase
LALRLVEHAGLTDVGRARDTNEDAFLEEPPLFAVADGMGGARAGEVASRIALEAFDDELDESAAPEAQLDRVVRSANRRIWDMAQQDEHHAGMGTTLSAVMLTDGEVAIGHVGDSRVYRLRGGELERLTTDHSLVEEFVRRGKITPEEAEVHPQRSIITRALGPEPDVEVETSTYSARDGDVYLICSDGLTGMISEDRVAEILRSASSLDAAAKELVAAANERGGRDNITVVLFRLADDAAADEDADTRTDLDAAAVREAAAADERDGGAKPPPADTTAVIPRAEAERARAGLPADPEPTGVTYHASSPAAPGARKQPESRATRGHMSRRRRVAAVLIGLLIAGAILVGLYVGSRQFYFLGTNDAGIVTLYRGVPYDLPLGIELYEEDYVSTVPASTLPDLQRRRVLDHELRGRGDAVDLVRQLERGN